IAPHCAMNIAWRLPPLYAVKAGTLGSLMCERTALATGSGEAASRRSLAAMQLMRSVVLAGDDGHAGREVLRTFAITTLVSQDVFPAPQRASVSCLINSAAFFFAAVSCASDEACWRMVSNACCTAAVASLAASLARWR